MIPMATIEEQTFNDIQTLADFLRGREQVELEHPIAALSVGEDGLVSTDGYEARLTEPAFRGLCRTMGIPEPFARNMPPDLFTFTTQRLARDNPGSARFHIQNGLMTAVMPSSHLPVRHDLVVRALLGEKQCATAFLGPNYLRLTLMESEELSILPGDFYQHGWELLNYENGLGPLQIRKYLLRLICCNGAVATDDLASFRRGPASKHSIASAMEAVREITLESGVPPKLDQAMQWANQNAVGEDLSRVIAYCAASLEGKTTRIGLAQLSERSTWYDVFNCLTAFGRIQPEETRRRYEVAGGELLSWFIQSGRTWPRWRRPVCSDCTANPQGDTSLN